MQRSKTTVINAINPVGIMLLQKEIIKKNNIVNDVMLDFSLNRIIVLLKKYL